MRDGVHLRADIFRPAKLEGQKLPVLLPWSPYGRTGTGVLQTTKAISGYQSESWDDDGAHFTYKFDKYTELCGFSKARLFMNCDEADDMDVCVIIRKLDRDGEALVHDNIPLLHQKEGVKTEDIPHTSVYKYIGPSGRLRASKRLTAEEPDLSEETRSLKDPSELWYPRNESQKVPAGEIVELNIALWPGGMIFEAGESLRFEVKGHNATLSDFTFLERNVNLNAGKSARRVSVPQRTHFTVDLLAETR